MKEVKSYQAIFDVSVCLNIFSYMPIISHCFWMKFVYAQALCSSAEQYGNAIQWETDPEKKSQLREVRERNLS